MYQPFVFLSALLLIFPVTGATGKLNAQEPCRLNQMRDLPVNYLDI